MARGSVQTSLERRRSQVEEYGNVAIKYSIVEGTIPLEGTGEAVTTVNFPIQFVEKPIFGFGHELEDNSWPESGTFPTASVTVVSWTVVARDESRKYFAGAEIALVVTGAEAMKSSVHFQFSGRAFRNPVVDAAGTVDTL